MIRRIFTGIFLFTLAVAAALFGNRHTSRESAAPQVPRGEELGYAAKDAQLTETGDDGRPLYTVDADVIRQLPAARIVALETVRVDYREEKNNQWILNAQHGTIHEGSDTIELSGNVQAVGMLPRMTDLAQIFTERLSYDPRGQEAQTDVPVRLQASGCDIDAAGLKANLKDQTVELESPAHGHCS
jgi:LPS export ABC transporter protein LptC